MATQRTLIPPRFRDDYSFSGIGRWQYQRVAVNARGVVEPVEPLHDGAPVPIRG